MDPRWLDNWGQLVQHHPVLFDEALPRVSHCSRAETTPHHHNHIYWYLKQDRKTWRARSSLPITPVLSNKTHPIMNSPQTLHVHKFMHKASHLEQCLLWLVFFQFVESALCVKTRDPFQKVGYDPTLSMLKLNSGKLQASFLFHKEGWFNAKQEGSVKLVSQREVTHTQSLLPQ